MNDLNLCLKRGNLKKIDWLLPLTKRIGQNLEIISVLLGVFFMVESPKKTQLWYIFLSNILW